MRKIKLFMVLFLLVAGVSGAWAQSYVYKGVTAEDARKNTTGDTYYLYNVGTGTFLYVGSTWGTKGSLLYDDLGLPITVEAGNLLSTTAYKFRTPHKGSVTGDKKGYWGMVDKTNAQNTPGMYADRSDYTGTGSGQGDDFIYSARWILEQVSTDITGGAIQYYLKNYYAANSQSAKSLTYPYGKNEDLGEVFYSASKQENPFYRWSIVSKTEILSVLTTNLAEAYGGLNASVTFLINNQGFYCKNNNSNAWKTSSSLSAYDNTDKNYGELTSVVGGTGNQLSFGKYYHVNLKGTGWLYQTIKVPRAGLYHIYCQGFDNDNNINNRAQFYAVSTETKPTEATINNFPNLSYNEDDIYQQRIALKGTTLTPTTSVQIPDYKVYRQGAWVDAATPTDATTCKNLAAGYAFYNGEYTNDLFVYVKNDNEYITIAINKTKSSSYTAVDDFHAMYMGEYPFVLDENQTRPVSVTVDDDGQEVITPETIGGNPTDPSVLEEAKEEALSNVTVLLKRTMTVGQWNTLVLPFNLSATAFKRAFGEATKLAKCTGLNQDNPNIITFELQDLSSDAGVIIEKGEFYLVDPGNGPSELDHDITFIDTEGTKRHIPAGTKFFTLGRQDFSGSDTDSRDWENADKKKIKTPESVLYKADNHNSIQLKGTYFRLDNFDSGDQRLYSDLENGESQKYVFGHKNDTYAMWRLGKTKRAIKGTRWWIEDVYNSGGAKEMMLLSFNGVVDGDETLAIDMEEGFTPVVRMDNKVYNLNGQVVNATLESLPRGIYVVNGKKYVVK